MKLVATGVLTIVLGTGCALETGGPTDNTPGAGVVDPSGGASQNPTGGTSGSPQSRLAAMNPGAATTAAGNDGTTTQPQPCPWEPIAGAFDGLVGGGDPSPGPGTGTPGNGTGSNVDTPRNLAGHLSPKNTTPQ
jgi:hypothetical protein